MSRLVLLFFAFCALAACTNNYDPPLAEVHNSDPTWPLAQDRLEYGTLPR